MENRFENDKYIIRYFPTDDIVEFFMKDQEIEAKDVIEMHDIVLGFVKGKKYGTIFTAQSFFSLSADARAEGAKPEYCEFLIAQAFIVRNLAQRLLGNFVVRFLPRPKQAKLFTDYQEARKWILEKIENHKKNKGMGIQPLVFNA
ncbi:MAG TPA: hypothetical protein VNZ49_10950 [Bacteroidia bacterium]|jgi:hypothetical protein|nr:hypothetical protein [Bacteroidia bacterium]